MKRGQQALTSLAEHAASADPAASSHWRGLHSTFRYDDGKLSGLRGFGGHSPRTFGVRLMHRVLQRPYRRLAKDPSVLDLAEEVAARQDRAVDLDMLRQALTLDLLAAWKAPFDKPVVVIGDGFGTLSSMILLRHPGSRVVTVNLTKTLIADLVYAARALPEVEYGLAESPADVGADRLTAIRAEDSELLRGLDLGLAVNVASMQEMEPSVIARYFELLRSSPSRPWFYCCNREEKILPDGMRVAFAEYPWKSADEVLIDELCPWHQSWYRPVPPFYFPYDGPHRHRLARLAA